MAESDEVPIVEQLHSQFTYALLERVDNTANVNRFYYLAWQPTLLESGAVIRCYGRRDGARRVLAPLPFASLAEAWPLIRAILRRRLQHGYWLAVPNDAQMILEQQHSVATKRTFSSFDITNVNPM